MKKIIVMICSLWFGIDIQSQQLKNFRLNDVENTERSFNDLKGSKLTLIDFWATWCVPCKKSIPALNKIYENFKSQGLNVIGINCDGPRSIAKVAPFSKAMQIKYPVLVDINSDVMNSLNLSAFPTLIIADYNGKIVWVHEGYVTGDDEIINKEIERILSEK